MWNFDQLLENLDSVPAWAKAMYVKGADGKYTLLPEVTERVDTTGLKSALDKERKTAKETKAALAAYQALGKLEELQDKLDAANERGDDKDAKKWEKRIAEMTKAHADALAAKDGEIVGMRGTVESYLVDAEATAAISELKGSATLLLPHVKSSVKVFNENGKYFPRVVDKDGEPRMNGQGYMGIKDLVAEMRKDKNFTMAFEASGTSGSGTRPGNAGGTPDSSKLNSTQKIEAGLDARKG